jgi:hypothetical protein
MTNSENPLARWSRLKREAAQDEEVRAGEAGAPGAAGDEASKPAGHPRQVASPPGSKPLKEPDFQEPALDVSTLPPIESITADSDIRAFLQSGVPAELTKAALRRVWTSDPAIRDFVGIAENQWDFTDPNAIPGFGPLEDGANLRDLLADAMGQLGEAPKASALAPAPPGPGPVEAANSPSDSHTPAQTAGTTEEIASVGHAEAPIETKTSAAVVAPQHANYGPETEQTAPMRNPRAHGSALPR